MRQYFENFAEHLPSVLFVTCSALVSVGVVVGPSLFGNSLSGNKDSIQPITLSARTSNTAPSQTSKPIPWVSIVLRQARIEHETLFKGGQLPSRVARDVALKRTAQQTTLSTSSKVIPGLDVKQGRLTQETRSLTRTNSRPEVVSPSSLTVESAKPAPSASVVSKRPAVQPLNTLAPLQKSVASQRVMSSEAQTVLSTAPALASVPQPTSLASPPRAQSVTRPSLRDPDEIPAAASVYSMPPAPPASVQVVTPAPPADDAKPPKANPQSSRDDPKLLRDGPNPRGR